MTVTYDYVTKQWVTGEEGRKARRQQIQDELTLLRSARGAHYARFTGLDHQSAIVRLEQEQASLGGAA